MHTHRRLIVNTALMTGSSIVMRCIALVFQAWLVGHIGAAGIGLYQLVLSVSVLFANFAISRHPLCRHAPDLRGDGA